MSLRSSSLWRPSSPISPTPATAAGPTLLLGWGAPGLHTNSITPEKVEGLLLIRMRFEEQAWNSAAAVGRACIRAAGALIAPYSGVVAVQGEWGAGEEGAFAPAAWGGRGYCQWVRALPSALGCQAAARAGKAGGDLFFGGGGGVCSSRVTVGAGARAGGDGGGVGGGCCCYCCGLLCRKGMRGKGGG